MFDMEFWSTKPMWEIELFLVELEKLKGRLKYNARLIKQKDNSYILRIRDNYIACSRDISVSSEVTLCQEDDLVLISTRWRPDLDSLSFVILLFIMWIVGVISDLTSAGHACTAQLVGLYILSFLGVMGFGVLFTFIVLLWAKHDLSEFINEYLL